MKLTLDLRIEPSRLFEKGDLLYFTAPDIAKYPGLKKISHKYHTITNIKNNLVELNGTFWVQWYVLRDKPFSIKKL